MKAHITRKMFDDINNHRLGLLAENMLLKQQIKALKRQGRGKIMVKPRKK